MALGKAFSAEEVRQAFSRQEGTQSGALVSSPVNMKKGAP
jgi:hypothetical protein